MIALVLKNEYSRFSVIQMDRYVGNVFILARESVPTIYGVHRKIKIQNNSDNGQKKFSVAAKHQ
jgi:hypothetical protein